MKVTAWTSLPITVEFLAEAYSLPPPIHRDPADRVLIATARQERLTLVIGEAVLARDSLSLSGCIGTPLSTSRSLDTQPRAAYEEAETLIRQVLTFRQRTLDPDHRDTLSAMLELADIRSARDDYVTAGAMFAEATRLATLAVGADNPLTLRGREAEIETIRGRGSHGTGGDREQTVGRRHRTTRARGTRSA